MIPELKSLINNILDDLESEKDEHARKDLVSDLRLLINGDTNLTINVLKEMIKKTRDQRNLLSNEVDRITKNVAVPSSQFVHEIINGC